MTETVEIRGFQRFLFFLMHISCALDF